MKRTSLLTAGLRSVQGRKRMKLILPFLVGLFTAHHSYAYCIDYKAPAGGTKFPAPYLHIKVRLLHDPLGRTFFGAGHNLSKYEKICNMKIKHTGLGGHTGMGQRFDKKDRIGMHIFVNEQSATTIKQINADAKDNLIITPNSATSLRIELQNEKGETKQVIENLSMNLK